MIDFDIEKCPHCGTEINFEANTCPECGAELPENANYCPHCGENVEDDYLECDECGKDITEEDNESYNSLSTEERDAIRINYERKKQKIEAEAEILKRQMDEQRNKETELYQIRANEEAALLADIEKYVKSHVSAALKLKILFTATTVDIQATLIYTGYKLLASLNKKDVTTALPKFVQSITALNKIVGKQNL